MSKLKGAGYTMIFGSFLGILGLALYPVIIKPMLNPEPYKEIRQRNIIKPPNRDV
ncbi:uncharacterized protein LOC107273725 [Cephus cinctus]|uniref:Uncharacterized protein LOC107273725 n=1 Tax=Cephus cinctus TaxID=211228 RepID=A0AAJ7RUC4_CEPCN|nr:uncharacterized protein LOC107273725 [Cephus cinctus]